jgi:polyhydroxyalkanoate synthesis repressor PhaR
MPPQARTAPDASPAAPQQPVVVKKYANRRLYNTESSSYITLDNLAEMVRAGRDFVVYDAKTGEDITRSVLTQIIVEEESKGSALLPTGFLRQLIGLYGDSMQGLLPRYLEQAMASFAHQQQQMRVAMQRTMGNFFPFGMEEMGRQNMAMMERAMSLFAPFYRHPEGPGSSEGAATPVSDEIASLRAELDSMRDQLSRALLKAAKADEPSSVPQLAVQQPATQQQQANGPQPSMPELVKPVSPGDSEHPREE